MMLLFIRCTLTYLSGLDQLFRSIYCLNYNAIIYYFIHYTDDGNEQIPPGFEEETIKTTTTTSPLEEVKPKEEEPKEVKPKEEEPKEEKPKEEEEVVYNSYTTLIYFYVVFI